METFREFKKFCDKKAVELLKPEHIKKYKKEIIIAKRFYDNGINLYKYLAENSCKVKTRYIIPFLIGITDEITGEEWDYKYVKSGSSGGVDIDLDFDPVGKQKIQEYLFEKYGEDRVLHVGTFNRLGIKAAAKDLLRVYNVDYTESNKFTKTLDPDLSWEDNVASLKENNPEMYKFYLDHQQVLDLTKHFVNKIRQGGKHAGGVVILDEPVYNRIPIDRVTGEIVTAFPESSQEQVLDEVGVVKFDILAISILDVIRNTIHMIDEKMFLIEEDGIKKIVPQSYLDKEIGEL
jgi:DNA polymerase-3 subunit alpha